MRPHKSWPPGDASKCHKADKQEAFTGLCICSYRDVLKATLPLAPDSPPQQKGPNKNTLYVNNRKLLIFWALCPSLGAAFPFSLINPTLCADLVVSWVNPLPHEPNLWPWRQELSTPAHNKLRASRLLGRCFTSGATPPALCCIGYFWDRGSRTIFLGWLWTVILLISASWVAGITDMSHCHWLSLTFNKLYCISESCLDSFHMGPKWLGIFWTEFSRDYLSSYSPVLWMRTSFEVRTDLAPSLIYSVIILHNLSES
jgi:hypothetical protein